MAGTAWRANDEIWIHQELENGKISITDLIVDHETQKLCDAGGRRGPVSVVGSKHTQYEFPGQIGFAMLGYHTSDDKEIKPGYCIDVSPLIEKCQDHHFLKSSEYKIAEISRMIAHKLSIFSALKIESFDEFGSKDDLEIFKKHIYLKGGIKILSPAELESFLAEQDTSSKKSGRFYDYYISEIEKEIAKSLIMDAIRTQ